jgi:16S rRNA (uracil1498-N3)-methyltransferase
MTVPRLHLSEPLRAGQEVRLAEGRAHYLVQVLRLRPGAAVRLFNATDGEWSARIERVERRAATLKVAAQERTAQPEPGPTLVFAPIRRNRLDWLVEKAVELGVARLVPVLTQRTIVRPESTARLQVIAVEAAEQCERLTVPPIEPPRPLFDRLAAWDAAAPILLADECRQAEALPDALRREWADTFLIGPEGGFAPEERERLLGMPGIVPASLGWRILRAETAALYALACWQMMAGTGRSGERAAAR